MTEDVHLYIIDTNVDHAISLAKATEAVSTVTVVTSFEEAKLVSHGLDALFISLMSAIEWGKIKVPAPLYQTRVIEMPNEWSSRARFGIPGIAIDPADDLSPTATTQLILKCSFDAIYEFNNGSGSLIKSVGAVATSLGLDKLAASDAGKFIAAIYDKPQEDGNSL